MASQGERREVAVPAHATSVVAWDIPAAVQAGERFRMKVGVKCSDECPLTNTDFVIYDQNGAQMAAGKLPGNRWPGTTGLYVAEVELQAPSGEGLYTWTVKCSGADVRAPQGEAAASFGFRVVSHPECLVRVETSDKTTRKPISGARVVMHPYRAVTDERGVAEMRIAKGGYKLFVSQTGYLTVGLPLEVTGDMTARAELELEPPRERN